MIYPRQTLSLELSASGIILPPSRALELSLGNVRTPGDLWTFVSSEGVEPEMVAESI